jgi:ectoine hydroxylase-related dioxygenase (phytanoyl-CoA dioxygenase family)
VSVEDHINEYGYAIIEGFVDKKRVARLSRLCEAMVEPHQASGIHGKPITNYVAANLFTRTRELDDLLTDPRLLSVFSSIVAATGRWGMNLSDVSIKYVVPDQNIRTLHRDDDFYPQLSRQSPFTANALLAIDPFDEAVGATTIVPGSHRWDHEIDQDHERISVEMNPGDLLVLSGRVWHGHGPNTTSDRIRRAFNFYVCAGWLQPGHDFRAGLSAQEVAKLPGELQRMLSCGVSGWTAETQDMGSTTSTRGTS